MELLFGIIVGIFVLIFLVAVHEFGHGIVARRNGVVVEEFGIGFPPLAWGKRIKKSVLGKNVKYTINWLPLGGFVKLQGENDAAAGKGDYGAASYWSKTKILFAGVVVNWLVAVLIFTVLAWTGLPKIPAIANQFSVDGDTRVERKPVRIMGLVEGYPAEKTGFKVYDEVLVFNGQKIETVEQLISNTTEYRGQTVSMTVKRDGVEQTKTVQLRDGNKSNFGAQLGQQERIHATWSAPIVGVVTTAQFTWETFKGVGGLLADLGGGIVSQFSFNDSTRKAGGEQLQKAEDSVAGPVAIVGMILPSAAEAGLTELLFITAIISLALTVMNVLPIPAFDGGRWFLMTLYKLRKKELTKEKEEKIVGISFMILMGLVVLITIADVKKFF